MRPVRPFSLALALLLLVAPAYAGVVIEMTASGESSGGSQTITVEGTRVRMDSGDGKTSMIFRDDAMWLLDHKAKKCQTIDAEGIRSLGDQLGAAMKEMEAQLAKLPPEQRKMMEKMMGDRMPAGLGAEPAERRIEAGAAEKVGAYSCTVHTLFVDDEKVWDVCAASSDSVEGFAEARPAFDAMSAFAEELRATLAKNMPALVQGLFDTPFSEMESIDGVPVRVRSYAGGRVQSETTLTSVANREVDATLFDKPKGYKQQDLADQIKKGR